MDLLVTYDVDTTSPAGARRLRQVAKICEGHGIRVQKSVFEVVCTEAQRAMLEHQLQDTIDHQLDSIRLYTLPSRALDNVDQIGTGIQTNHRADQII